MSDHDWNLHQLSDSHTGCTSIPLPNHSRNIKGGLIVGHGNRMEGPTDLIVGVYLHTRRISHELVVGSMKM